MGIEPIAFAWFARTPSSLSRPARIDLEDRFTLRHKKLGEATAILPGSFTAPLAGSWEGLSPGEQTLPPVGGVCTAPVPKDRAGIVEGECLMDGFVGIDTYGDHEILLLHDGADRTLLG